MFAEILVANNSVMARPNSNSNIQQDHLKEESEFWDLYREVMAEKGVDISRFYATAAEQVKQDFSTTGARADFAELCILGCSPEVLAYLACREQGLFSIS